MLGYDKLLKEECSYEKYSGNNKYNEKSYSKAETLNCFISFEFDNERRMDEQTITLTKKVFIRNEFEPDPNDKVDGLEIKSIRAVKGLRVPIIGWEIVV